MAFEILSRLIGDKNVLDMSVSEAKKIIADFYMEIEIQTLGYSDEHKIDFMCDRVLHKFGLDILAGTAA